MEEGRGGETGRVRRVEMKRVKGKGSTGAWMAGRGRNGGMRLEDVREGMGD